MDRSLSFLSSWNDPVMLAEHTMQSKGNKWCFVIVAGLRLYLYHCSHLFPVGNARRRLICGNGCAQLVPAAEVFRTEGWQQGPKRPLRQWQSNRVLRLGHINFCSSTGPYFATVLGIWMQVFPSSAVWKTCLRSAGLPWIFSSVKPTFSNVRLAWLNHHFLHYMERQTFPQTKMG